MITWAFLSSLLPFFPALAVVPLLTSLFQSISSTFKIVENISTFFTPVFVTVWSAVTWFIKEFLVGLYDTFKNPPVLIVIITLIIITFFITELMMYGEIVALHQKIETLQKHLAKAHIIG